jgi:hypothetical protein
MSYIAKSLYHITLKPKAYNKKLENNDNNITIYYYNIEEVNFAPHNNIGIDF